MIAKSLNPGETFVVSILGVSPRAGPVWQG
jgi:hypothetical protein